MAQKRRIKLNRKLGFDKNNYIKSSIREAKKKLLDELNKAYNIETRTFSIICMFSIIDCLAQEYANYPLYKSQKAFCDFVLEFQNRFDYLENVDPITLFYDYELEIEEQRKVQGDKSTDFENCDEFQFDIWQEGVLLDQRLFKEFIRSKTAEQIIGMVEQYTGGNKKKITDKHSLIALIYKMRSKAVHELSNLGAENKFEREDGLKEPFYRYISWMYIENGGPVVEDVLELVIPRVFVYDLCKNIINRYMAFCRKMNRIPFENNTLGKRKVALAWTDE